MPLTFDWLTARFTVDAPAEVAAVLRDLFRPLVAADPECEADLRVLRTKVGYRVTPPPDHPDVADGCAATLPDVISLVEVAITRGLLARESRHLHLHAAGAVGPTGGAVLALGSSGRGKSAFAAACIAAGRPLLGDDVVALDAEARAVPLPRPVKIDTEWVATLGQDPEVTPARDPAADDVWLVPGAPAPAEGPGSWARGPTPVSRLIEIRYRRGAPLRMEPVEPSAALRLLLDSLHHSAQGAPGIPDTLIRLADEVPAVRIEHGDAREVVAVVLDGPPE